jgi:hypothetical protein
MQPATIHFVVTPESAICHGGHAYAMSTMVRSLHGIYHAFVASSVVTNTDHTNTTRHLLERMLVHLHDVLVVPGLGREDLCNTPSHIPDLESRDGFLDLIHLCIAGEFGEILNAHTYSNPLDIQSKVFSMYARGCARNLIAWASGTIQVDPEGRFDAADVFWDILQYHTQTLVQYKNWAECCDIYPDDKDCTAHQFEERLKSCFTGNAPFHYSDRDLLVRSEKRSGSWNPNNGSFTWPPGSNNYIVQHNLTSTVDRQVSKRKGLPSITISNLTSCCYQVAPKEIILHGAFAEDVDFVEALSEEGEDTIDKWIEKWHSASIMKLRNQK